MDARAPAAAAATNAPSQEDAAYGVDEDVLKEVRNNKVWMQDPKYFKKVIVSPSAAMKMMNHAHSGVEKGIKAGGKPVEIMGLILGHVSTQLQWQRSEDPNGNPWLAIVLDPLRSLAKKRPEMGAFRVYPPEYTAPVNETPDGTIVTDDAARIERYYTLEVDYFMSSVGSDIVNILSEEFLWMRTLSSNSMQERENRDRFSERIQLLASKLDGCESLLAPRTRNTRIGDYYVPEKQTKDSEDSMLDKITQAANELSIEHSHGQELQLAKKALFNDKF
ncbi:hypothetical protein ATCC90586_008619 [Pythium insidiosum]|nr:hypothetical protein ATCC90586_008619 [Pythium insidiosum]